MCKATETKMATAQDELYAKPTFVGYSLWVAPEAQAEQSLSDAITEHAERLQTPSFLPHMTLLGGVMVGPAMCLSHRHCAVSLLALALTSGDGAAHDCF